MTIEISPRHDLAIVSLPMAGDGTDDALGGARSPTCATT